MSKGILGGETLSPYENYNFKVDYVDQSQEYRRLKKNNYWVRNLKSKSLGSRGQKLTINQSLVKNQMNKLKVNGRYDNLIFTSGDRYLP